MSATNLGSIFWRVDADTSGAVNGLRNVNRAADRTDRGVRASAKSITSSLSKIASGVSIGLLVRQLVTVQREFDKLNAAVLTSTGTVEGAAMAFDALERFAAETPFALEQSVTAFTKLVNFGLTPSEKAMRSYGDTASALGKDLNQMIEAVADAATGEFERLKEFGIKAKNNGDTIAFTFRGTTRTVKNNAAEIESYLIKLGQNNFAGSMANRMATLDGAISNFSDTWDQLFRTVSSQGAGSIIASGVRTATESIETLIKMIESGQLDGIMQTVANAWRVSFGNIGRDIATLTDFMLMEFGVMEKSGSYVPELLSNAFFHFPANIKAAVQLATVEILAFVDKAKAVAKQLNIDLNPFADADEGTYEADLAKIEKLRSDMTASILATRDKEIKSVNSEREAVERATLAWKKNEEAKRKAGKGKDVLAGFKVEKDETDDFVGPPEPDVKEKKRREIEQKTAITTTESIVSRGETPEDRRNAEMESLKAWRDNELINAKEFEAARTQLEQEGANARAQVATMALGSFSNSFGELAGVLKNSEGEQSTAYKAMFALSKGFAVAQSGLNLALAISNAMASGPFPWNLGAMASVAAAGVGVVSAVAGATYSGRENGGSVIGGQTYEVGEKNKPELLMIPGNKGKVFSNSEAKNMMGGGGGGYQAPIINNYVAGNGVSVQHRRDELTKRDVFDIVQSEMTNPNSRGRRGMQSNSNMHGVLNGNRRS